MEIKAMAGHWAFLVKSPTILDNPTPAQIQRNGRAADALRARGSIHTKASVQKTKTPAPSAQVRRSRASRRQFPKRSEPDRPNAIAAMLKRPLEAFIHSRK